MRISVTSFALPKSGNEQTGSDDAISHETCQSIELSEAIEFRLAIADGASGSICAGTWARQLVAAFEQGRLADDEQSWPFGELAAEWIASTRQLLRDRYGDDLPWFIEEKLQQPAQAALLGFRASIEGPHADFATWNAIAVGDACLFHLDPEGHVESFPISNAQHFGNDPALVPASADGAAAIQRFARRRSPARAVSGDVFLVMTDAMAACALADTSELSVLDKILKEGSSDSFHNWVANKRLLHHLKNDDVTVARLLFE